MTEKAYLQKLEENKKIIFKIVNLYADDLEDQRDLYQEIVYQSWSAYERFEGNSKFSTWLYRISINVALTFLKKQKRNIQIDENRLQNIAYQQEELSERADFLYNAIKQLPEIDRSIIMMHLDGFENGEIAEMMGLSKNNTNVKLHRIKQNLTTILTKK